MTAETPTHETRIMFGASPRPSLLAALGLSVLVWLDFSENTWIGALSVVIGLLGVRTMNPPTRGRLAWYSAGIVLLAIMGSIFISYAVTRLLPLDDSSTLIASIFMSQAVATFALYRIFRKLMPVLPQGPKAG